MLLMSYFSYPHSACDDAISFRYRRAEALADKISVYTQSDSNGLVTTSFTKAFFNPT